MRFILGKGCFPPAWNGWTGLIAALLLAGCGGEGNNMNSNNGMNGGLPGVYTYHNNLARDGTNTRETVLTPANVNQAAFGKLFFCPVDGQVYTQPLWVPGLNIGGVVHNVVLVATQHDSAYAFDADASPCVTLWHAPLLDSSHGGSAGEASVHWNHVGNGQQDLYPEIGVTGTPVIDPSTHTLYVVSKSEGPTGTFHQRLHALDLATGDEKFSGPVDITASVSGMGYDSTGGSVAFNPQTENQRCALALVNGIVYIAWAAHEDKGPYHGWVIGYNAANLTRVAAYNETTNGNEGGIWMSGSAPAADASGNLYVSTGNGTFDGDSVSAPNNDFGDTVLKLSTSAGLSVSNWFTPFNQAVLQANDADLGSGGVVLLPNNLLITGGKQGKLYVLNRNAMGGYCASCTTTDTNIVQSFMVAPAYGTPAFWQNALYFAGAGSPLNRYAFDSANGRFNTSPTHQSGNVFPFPATTPSISSDGGSNGIAWAIDSSGNAAVPAVLYAYDAANLTELWDSSQAGGDRDTPGNAVKFSVPTVINGKVYIGTATSIDVYGLLP